MLPETLPHPLISTNKQAPSQAETFRKASGRDNYAESKEELFRGFWPYVIKSTLAVSALKCDKKGEIIRGFKIFDDNVLIVIKDCAFVKDIVQGKNYSYKEKAKGLTEPKPD